MWKLGLQEVVLFKGQGVAGCFLPDTRVCDLNQWLYSVGGSLYCVILGNSPNLSELLSVFFH